MDLASYAEQQERDSRGKSRCVTCNLEPEIREQIEAARARTPKPITFPLIEKWLASEYGIKIQHATIRNHFIAGHAND